MDFCGATSNERLSVSGGIWKAFCLQSPLLKRHCHQGLLGHSMAMLSGFPGSGQEAEEVRFMLPRVPLSHSLKQLIFCQNGKSYWGFQVSQQLLQSCKSKSDRRKSSFRFWGAYQILLQVTVYSRMGLELLLFPFSEAMIPWKNAIFWGGSL